jgi:elongation factor P
VLEKTFKSNDTLESADVADRDMQYLYNDGEYWHFMEPDTFDLYQADKNAVGDAALWMKEEDICMVTLYNGAPLAVTPPNHVVMEVMETDPGLRGDTATGGTKPATLATGAVVRVPLFMNVGDLIKIDTRTGEYLGRSKE